MTFGFEAFDLRLSEAHEGLSLFTNFHTFEFLPFFSLLLFLQKIGGSKSRLLFCTFRVIWHDLFSFEISKLP